MALLLAFAGWTLFVWGTRVSNILSDGGGTAALVVALGLVVLAVAVAGHAFLCAVPASRRPPAAARLALAVPVLVLATVTVWAVRLPGVLLHDHSAGFKVVHLALGVVSVVLALLAARRSTERVPA